MASWKARRDQGHYYPGLPCSQTSSHSTGPARSRLLHEKAVKSLRNARILALRSFNKVAAQTGTILNRLTPVKRLTDDILLLVFQQLDIPARFYAAKVSQRWRTLALSISSLWANIELSCRSGNFEQQFLLLKNRSRDALLDITLVMESNIVEFLEYSHRHMPAEVVNDRLYQQCEIDLKQQLENRISRLVLAPDVLARTRTLDITSMIDTRHRRYRHVNRVTQPEQRLQLAASPSLRRLRLNWARPETHELELIISEDPCAFDSVSSL